MRVQFYASHQPDWVCADCGDKYRAGEWFAVSTWHEGLCGVCDEQKPVTEPRDCGYLKEGWQLDALAKLSQDMGGN